jgi:hypothetical protein
VRLGLLIPELHGLIVGLIHSILAHEIHLGWTFISLVEMGIVVRLREQTVRILRARRQRFLLLLVAQ